MNLKIDNHFSYYTTFQFMILRLRQIEKNTQLIIGYFLNYLSLFTST